MNHSTIKAQIYKVLPDVVQNQIYLLHGPRGVMRAHNRVKHFYICLNGENLLKKPLSQNSSNLLAKVL
jgi:hypothetical protein